MKSIKWWREGSKKLWTEIYNDPFKFVDNLNLAVGPFDFNFARKYKTAFQRTALILALTSLVAWIVFGFDSCIGQPMMTIYNLPRFFSGEIGIQGLIDVWNNHYGKEFHWSAVVIYGLCFYFLSKHFEKHGIVKSKNVAFSAGLTWLTIGLFEFYWMSSFAYFQNQFWVITMQWPQLRILMQNIVFLSVGSLVVLYMFVDSYILDANDDPIERRYTFNWNWLSYLLIGATLITAVVWWFYPWPTQQFQVTYENSEVWTSSPLFPQTLYTIDLNPNDNVNAGEWYWIQNDGVHAWNTLVKVLLTLSIFNIGLIKRTTK